MQNKILAIMEEMFNLEHGGITVDTLMDDIESWDSLTHVMLIGEIESRLGISIPLDKAIEITCVKDLLEAAGL